MINTSIPTKISHGVRGIFYYMVRSKRAKML